MRSRLQVGLKAGARRARRAVQSALNLLRSAPALSKELKEARRELERERRRLKQTRRQIREQRRQLEQRERRLKERRARFKRTVRDYLLRKMPERSVCAEIGVHEGDFSRQILDAVNPQRLHLIDPWQHSEGYPQALFGGLVPEGQASLNNRYEEVKARFAEEIRDGRVEIHRDLSSAVSGEFEDSYFDWIYIDGNHMYEFVKQDLELYLPKVRSGGYIAGDDYGGRGWWDNGVQKAVDEFVDLRTELNLEIIDKQFVIKVP